jgi:hypothetical protein
MEHTRILYDTNMSTIDGPKLQQNHECQFSIPKFIGAECISERLKKYKTLLSKRINKWNKHKVLLIDEVILSVVIAV